MADKIGSEHRGSVIGVQPFGLFVELVEHQAVGLVHVSSMADDRYAFREKTQTLEGRNGRRVYGLGDTVQVRVVDVDLERRQVGLALADMIGRQPERVPRANQSRRARTRTSSAPERRGH